MVSLMGLAACSGGNDDPDCDGDDPCVTPTRTPGATNTPRPTSTPKPTASPTATPSPAATATAAPNACLPSSSLGILVQKTDATAYVPKGNWGGGPAGVTVVPVETIAGVGKGGPSTSITTPNTVNSCSCNSTTGVTVCVANNADTYLISGTTLTKTLTSGASGTARFSGGLCMNCGVVVDSASNTAVIAMGLSTGPAGGYQSLDLATNTFAAPLPSGTGISEDIAVDPIRHLILSPNEGFTTSTSVGTYEIVQTKPSTKIFENQIVPIPTPTPIGAPPVSNDLDSAGEDCTTGIALSTDEGTGNLFIADLTQATFTAGTPTGTWSAPSQFQHFMEFEGLSAGTSGIAVAPGTHLAIVTGEFGGNLEGVIQLPATSGTGIPAVVDWVAFVVPNLPGGGRWSQGFDPHTVTAYVSPNTHKAFAVLGNDSFTFLAVVDLDGLLKAKRTGAHTVDPTVDLVKAGLVTFIAE
jgi:hypothetical protein